MTDPDTYLRIQAIKCATCGAQAEVFPNRDDAPVICPSCSPKWARSFAAFRTSIARADAGLTPVEEIDDIADGGVA